MRSVPLLFVIAPLWLATAMPAGAGEIVLVPSEVPWTEPDREDLRLALEALPQALRDFPGGPLELELHASERPFGMGGWTGGRTRFHLHRRAPMAERRAALKLEGLPDEAQERLWRRRAVVHAILQRWDDARAWSDRTVWRRLSGWIAPFERLFTWSERPSNLYEGAYSRALGATSSSLDLVTFAEEYFIPPPDGPIDESLRCQEFSKVRVFEALLQESLGIEPPAPARCPAFEAWAELEALSHLEVLLVASSGRAPESLFGHILLRPVYREGETIRPPTLQTVIQIAAMTDAEQGAGYFVRGIFGGYRITVFTITAGDLAREVLEYEDRTVRRFRVNATAEENRQVLQRAWELERRGYYDYKFFSDNCATVLVSLLESALDEGIDVRYRGALVVSPTSALDALAETTRQLNGRETPLLSPEWGRLESVRDMAVDAELRRGELERRLLAQVTPQERDVLVASFEEARSSDPVRRQRAWHTLAELTSGMTRRETLAESLYAWWALTVRVERRALEQVKRVELEIDAARLKGRTIPRAPGEDVEQRQRLFERESDMAVRQMVLDRAEQRRVALEHVERRPPTPMEAEQLASCERTREAFDALTTLHGELVERRFADRDPYAWLAQDQHVRMQRERETLERAPIRSGSWRTGAGRGHPAAGGRAGSARRRSSYGRVPRAAGRRSRSRTQSPGRAARAGGGGPAAPGHGASRAALQPVHPDGLPNPCCATRRASEAGSSITSAGASHCPESTGRAGCCATARWQRWTASSSSTKQGRREATRCSASGRRGDRPDRDRVRRGRCATAEPLTPNAASGRCAQRASPGGAVATDGQHRDGHALAP